MTPFEQFGERVANSQDKLGDKDRVIQEAREEFLSRVPVGRSARAGRGLAVGLVAAGAIAAAAVMLLVVGGEAMSVRVGSEGRELIKGEWIYSESKEISLNFSDGSTVDLQPSSGARVVELEENGARVLLEKGSARVDVVHREDTSWKVDVGPYQVSVTGTSFNVEWDPGEQTFGVDLTEGSVIVTGPLVAEGKRVSAGESLRAWLPDGRVEIVATELAARDETPKMDERESPGDRVPAEISGVSHDARPDSKIEVPTPLPEPARAGKNSRETPSAVDSSSPPAQEKPAAETWSDLATSGKYDRAVQVAEEQGFEGIVASASPGQLMALGDASRLSRKWKRADQCYLAVRERFAGSKQAASAALALGRMAFDQQHMYSKSARWLNVYIEEGGSGSLVREALGRLVEARERAGDPAGARVAAERYLASYPQGPHAAYARKLLSPGTH